MVQTDEPGRKPALDGSPGGGAAAPAVRVAAALAVAWVVDPLKETPSHVSSVRGIDLLDNAGSKPIDIRVPRPHRRLLDDSVRAGVWPDSVQVSGGKLSMRLPTDSTVWLAIGLHPVGHRDEAWLQKGLPCS